MLVGIVTGDVIVPVFVIDEIVESIVPVPEIVPELMRILPLLMVNVLLLLSVIVPVLLRFMLGPIIIASVEERVNPAT